MPVPRGGWELLVSENAVGGDAKKEKWVLSAYCKAFHKRAGMVSLFFVLVAVFVCVIFVWFVCLFHQQFRK